MTEKTTPSALADERLTDNALLERRLGYLMRLKERTPDYEGDDARALHYQAERDALNAAIQALRTSPGVAAPAADGWRDISTAPKDGRRVLLGMTDADPPGWTAEGYYEEDDERGWFAANTHWTDAHDGQLYPSHWQPLPLPPGKAVEP